MPFLSRRSVDPLTSVSPPREKGYPQKQSVLSSPRIRARSEASLFRRVSTLFTVRRRNSTKVSFSKTNTSSAGIGYVRAYPWNTLPRVSSDSTPHSSLEIRRPSGLGRRASLLESASSTSESFSDSDSFSFGTVLLDDEGEAVTETALARLPLPNSLGGVSHHSPDRSRPRYATSFTLPDPIFRAVLEFVPRQDLPAVALVSRGFCAAARYALYHALDSQSMHTSAREKLFGVLASKKELAALVVSFRCHSWPSCELGRHSSVRQAFQNMYNLKSLTLPSFVSILSHTPSFTFSLTHLTILDERMTQSQLVVLRSWLATQPSLESLSFPHLAEYTRTEPLFVDEWVPASDPNGHGTPFTAILPGLKSLRASAEIVSALCFAMHHPIQHLTLDVHATLYAGLRPGAVIRSLRGVRDMRIIFAREVDKRTVEKFLGIAGSVLTGGNKPEAIKSLEVEVSWTDDDGAETLYGIVTSIISRFRGLQTLKLTSPFRSLQAPTPVLVPAAVSVPHALRRPPSPRPGPSPALLPSPSPPQIAALSAPASTPTPPHHHHGGGGTICKEFVTCGIEQSYARTWTRHCPSLSDIQFDFTCSTADADVELCGMWFRRKVPFVSRPEAP